MKVAVVFGGASLEAEVSRASAEGVCRALEAAHHDPVPLELGPGLPSSLLRASFDVVFPVAHGAQGEDGCLQGLLEILGLPYVGSGVLASATAADKVATKRVYRSAGLPVARDLVLAPGRLPDLAEIRVALGSPFVIKPVSGGSSFGVSRIGHDASAEDFARAFGDATAHGPALTEELIQGTELTCGVLDEGDEGGIRALPPTQVEAQAGDFYDYTSKYARGGSLHRTPAPLVAEETARVQDLAVQAHLALGARELSRTDMILGPDGRLTLLETNTLPGMTGVSLFPEGALALGIGFPDLVDRLVRSAQRRAASGLAAARGVALPEPFA